MTNEMLIIDIDFGKCIIFEGVKDTCIFYKEVITEQDGPGIAVIEQDELGTKMFTTGQD